MYKPLRSRRQTLDDAERKFFEKIQVLIGGTKRSRAIRKKEFQIICGVDAAYSVNDCVVAIASSFDSANGELLEQHAYQGNATFPYVPGLFFLREGPFVTEAVSGLRTKPDLVCFDAQGMAHPRRMGLATICGMVLEIPSIGIAKSRLAGKIQVYKPGLDKLVSDKNDERELLIGLVTSHPYKRYWSAGYSISIRELEPIVINYGDVCLKSIAESHNQSTKALRSKESKFRDSHSTELE